MKDISSRALTGVMPLMMISPLEMGVRPATMRSSVDLPHPEGPRMLRNSPFGMVSEMFSSTGAAEAKRLLTPRNAISGIVPLTA
jgi:hypothetical protein